MKKKGIFGGTFDPIHNGHLHIAYEALYKLNLDKVIFIPSGNPPHKTDKVITDAEIRYKLVKDVIEYEQKFEVSDYELNNRSLSYTYKTLKHFNEEHKETEWYFITGADCLMQLDSWKNINEVLSLCNFVVFKRSGYSMKEMLEQKNRIEKKFNKKIIFLDIPVIDISSTTIRDKIKNRENISYLVPERARYIVNKMNLYK